MPKLKVSPTDLVMQAIHEAGTTDPGVISLQIEDIIKRKIRTWKARNTSVIYQELGRYGIERYSDVVKLVEQVRRAV